MAYEKKNLSRAELSAIRSRASKMRKKFSGGGGHRKKPDERAEKTRQMAVGLWAHSVFAARAEAKGISMKTFLDRVAVLLAKQNGIPIPNHVVEKK